MGLSLSIPSMMTLNITRLQIPPGRLMGFPLIDDVDLNKPFDWMPESFYHWCIHKGLHPWKKVEDFPEHYYGTIDAVIAK